ncbi:MAG: pilus assembly protein [Actinomycetota bacterium]|nr:pilus assembly protein [Actinomycetota bacterium]
MNGRARGAAAVELAMALPLLLFMLFGLVQIIILIDTKTIFEHAAFEAARTGAVSADPQTAKGRALRVIQAVPRGAGFRGDAAKITLTEAGGSIIAEVSSKIALLPFFRQASLAAGGDGALTLRARAKLKKEPFLGY